MDINDIDHPSVAFDLPEDNFYSGFDIYTEWKGSNGKIFIISEMSSQHIENSLRSIYRENIQDVRKESIEALHEERIKRVNNASWNPGKMIGKAPDRYFEQFREFFQYVKVNKNNGMVLWLDDLK
jgi:hypothetical protein